jgi:hypothetical protein
MRHMARRARAVRIARSTPLSHAWDTGNVPRMGQDSKQLEPYPEETSFALGRTLDEAREAKRRVELLVGQAETVRDIVLAQAVFALKESGMSLREIEGALGVSRSSAWRKLATGHASYALPAFGDSEAIRAEISAAWGPGESGR